MTATSEPTPPGDGRRPDRHERRPAAGTHELDPLERLLGDGSPAVRSELRRRFEMAGKPGIAVLRRAARSDDAGVRGHARTLLIEAERRRTLRRLYRFALAGHLSLERGLFLLAALHTPGLDARPYRRALDSKAARVRRRGAGRATPLERARALVEYLGVELGYTGDTEDYHHPDNAYLHRVIERKRGLPLSLVALYLLVGRRAGLDVAAVPLPGHVMLRLSGAKQSLIVDPFHDGDTRSQATLMGYLAQHGLAFRPEWFREASDAMLLQRQAGNLARSFADRKLMREARALERVAQMLADRVQAEGR